jgi:hypothetical protein
VPGIAIQGGDQVTGQAGKYDEHGADDDPGGGDHGQVGLPQAGQIILQPAPAARKAGCSALRNSELGVLARL